MGVATISEWRKLPVTLAELCLDTSLRCGQSFRWRQSGDGEWFAAFDCPITLAVAEGAESGPARSVADFSPYVRTPRISFTGPSSRREATIQDECTVLVRQYFNLEPNLTGLYARWSTADANFRQKASQFSGIRILRQDAWEAVVGFICSSNNNIARISQMVEKLCRHYGPVVGQLGSHTYYDLPPADALTGSGVEGHLRQLGFGYRAKYLHQTAIMVADERPAGWLESLRSPASIVADEGMAEHEPLPPGGRDGYRKAHEEILQLQGVGPKVADCVCLMGLGWREAVPVDTHVWQIAQRDYRFGRGKYKTLTKATYDAVGDHFRALWGREAGWAHSVLFTADLRTFAEQLKSSPSRTAADAAVAVKAEAEADAGAGGLATSSSVAEVIVRTHPTSKRVLRTKTPTGAVHVTSEVQTPTVRRSKRQRIR
ncbi:MAG: 8-oxoguanine glycosylase ogg1 [Phylliscum demangeonii]|nr:MAG: 8-oxoguanine glycosylase ogg1 [Phylliscum demangeonii]